jgi:hypothetical protein
MSRAFKQLHGQQGAALIEGFASMLALLTFLVVILFVGVAYYNTSVMNTATQNISLGVQTQLRVCSNAGEMCDQANNQIDKLTQNISSQTFGSLALTDKSSTATTETTLWCLPPGISSTHSTPPDAKNWPSTPGWGYTKVQMEVPSIGFLMPWGNNNLHKVDLIYKSTALGFSFAPVTSTANTPAASCQGGKVYPS